MTGAALRMTWHDFFVAGAVLSTGGLEKSQNALARGCQLCTQLSILEGSLAELLRFGGCQVQKLKKSRGIALFRMLSSSKIGRLAELFRFGRCYAQTLRKSRRISSFDLADR